MSIIAGLVQELGLLIVQILLGGGQQEKPVSLRLVLVPSQAIVH